jgi:ABC-type dipeptide/oligopeptide/nickel transport system permease subunit
MIRTVAICFLVVMILAALLPVRYERQFRDFPNARRSKQFALGTDDLGRDRLSRLIYGTRVSLLLALAASSLSCIAAAVLGGAAGFGVADKLILGAADLFLTLPWLFLLLMVRALLPLNVSPMVSVTITFALLGVLGWAAPAKVIRAAVRKLRTSDFMLQARAAGCPASSLLFRHLLPNAMPVLWAQLWITIPAYVLAETTLGMLGLGVMEPLPSWGNLLREVEGAGIADQPWLLAPVLLLAAVVGSFQVIFEREDYSV